MLLQILDERSRSLEPKPEHPPVTREDRCPRIARQQQNTTRFRRMTGAQLEERLVGPGRPFEQQLHLATRRTKRTQARVDHARVVDYHDIAGLNEPWKRREGQI